MLAEVSNDLFASLLKLENSFVGDSISWLVPGKSDHFPLLSQDRQAAGSMANRNLIKAKGRSGPELWWKWCSTVRIGTDPELQSYSGKSVKTEYQKLTLAALRLPTSKLEKFCAAMQDSNWRTLSRQGSPM